MFRTCRTVEKKYNIYNTKKFQIFSQTLFYYKNIPTCKNEQKSTQTNELTDTNGSKDNYDGIRIFFFFLLKSTPCASDLCYVHAPHTSKLRQCMHLTQITWVRCTSQPKISECNPDNDNTDLQYSHSHNEVNKEKHLQRRKYHKRRITPSDRVTRQVAKQMASNQTC